MRSLLGALLALPCLTCGDATVDGGFRGEPLARFAGEVDHAFPRAPVVPEGLRAALFWDLDGADGDGSRMIEDPTTGRAIAAAPSDFVLNLFDPPPSAALVDGAWAVGRMRLYVDADGDGQRGPEEGFAGGEVAYGFVYAAVELSPEASPIGRPLPPGVHRVRLPQLCGAAVVGSDPDDCGVELGASCNPERPCMGGRCINALPGESWPGGACVLVEPDPCSPAGGARVPTADGQIVWTAGCRSAEDCRRGYSCDPGLRACMPTEPLTLFIDNPLAEPRALHPYCATADPG